MKYVFKDPKYKEALKILGYTEEEINYYENHWSWVDEHYKNKISDSVYKYCSKSKLAVSFHKDCFRQIKEYTSEDWNIYPEVIPPVSSQDYLVLCKSISGDTFIAMDHFTKGQWLNHPGYVIAFRPLPEIPKELE